MTKNYLFKILVICAVLCQFFTKAQAQYAIGGTAGNTLTKSVYWLTWDPTATGSTLITVPTGADSQHITNGTYVWQYSPTVRITAVITNEVFVNSIAMQAYTPGNFTGDGLDLLYSGNNLPKPGSRGVENSGISTTGGGTVTFDIDVKVAILINGVYTDVVYPGMVIGDAESIDSQGEYISGDTPNPVAWQLLNKRTQNNAADTHYLMDLSNNGRSFKLYADLAPGNFGVQAVMFAHNARNLVNLSMRGSGITAMAIGFVLPFDQGDAPSSYGSTGHYIDDFVITDFFAGNGTYAVVNYNTTPLIPQATVYIGANNVDADGTVAFDALASGDDNTGNADESTLSPSTLPDLKVNQVGDYSFTVPVTNNKAIPATLYAWVDFNGDGVFGADELVTATVSRNTVNQNITITFPNSLFASKIKAGLLYGRLRVTTTNLLDVVGTTIDERSTAYAADGEAEDYRLKSILGVTISGTVRDDANGNLDGAISGTGVGIISGSQLYAYLVNGTAIIDKATVAANGTYSFTGVNNGNYTVAISTNNVAIGSTLASVAANLPSAWIPSGETYGANNSAGTGIEAGTPNMQIIVSTPGTSLDINGIDFGLDQVPVANTDNVTATAGQPLAINVLANDTDADGTIDVTSVRIVDPADNTAKTSVTIAGQGTYTVNTTNGVVTFTPLVTFSGNSTPVSYTIRDNFGAPSSSTVTAQISVSVRPTGTNDTDITLVNNPVTTNVKANDGTANANATVIAGNGTNGTTVVNASGTVTYTPANGFTGVDTYTYTLTNGALVSDPITVTITVSATPIGVADAGTTPVATPVTTNVLANDGSFATGSTVNAGTAPAHGGIVVNADNTITYTPAATFTGIDTYTYTITKSGATSNPITVTIRVVPVGVNDAVTTPLNTAVLTTVKTNDGASATGTTVAATNGTNGTTAVNATDQVTFTPTANYIGTDVYTYTLTTADGVASSPITVNVTIRPAGVADASSTPINTAVATTVTANDGLSATGATVTAGNGAHGTTTVNAGVVTFTPTAGYVGLDTYTYTLTNNGVVSDPITVTITVNPAGVADVATTPLNTAVATTVLANDGLSGVGATVTPINGANGTTSVNGTGVVTFTPTTGFIGVTTYTYTLTNNGATSAPVTVTVTVRPTGVADAATTPLNTAVATTVTANDGASATGATVTAGNGANGTTAVAGGVVTFTPNTGYIGIDTYTYTLTNNGAVSDPITVTVNVNPVGVNDVATTPINTPVATTVTANDGISGTGATVTPTNGAHGTTTATGGVVTYTPATGYIGLDAYTYTLTNNGATSAPVTVNVSVRPAGVADAAVTGTGIPVAVTVKANDGASATGTTVAAINGTNGITTVSATGVVTYTPTVAFTGTDTFTYTLITPDGVVSDPVTVTVTVNPLPAGVADAVATPINTAVTTTVTANDGADGVGATVAAGAQPAHGAIVINADNTVTYTPVTSYIGLDTYTYTITKAGLTSNPITVTVSVRPVGVNDAATTPLNTSVATTVKNNDGASATGTTVTPTAPAHGTTTVSATGVVTYTPTNNYIGLDTYTYTLTTPDGVVSAPVTVTVSVRPVGVSEIVTTGVNTPVATAVKANDGVSGVGTTVTATTPAHGTTTVDANGIVTYTPTTGYLGSDNYTYTLTTTDGVLSDPVNVIVNVRPTGVADAAVTTINTPVATTVTANDGPAGVGATVTPTAGAHGTTTVNAAGVVTYTPATGYIGLDTYTYTLTNNGSVSDAITVNVTVRPVAVADVAVTTINTPVTTTVKTNDGASGTGTTVTASTPAHGTTTVDAAGVVTYTPTAGYIGTDTYTYTLTTTDGVVSVPASVSVSVKPLGVADADITNIGTAVTTTVKTNDGASGTGTTVTATAGAHGTTTVNAAGQVVFTPAAGYIGKDTYTYTLNTADGVASDAITVTINIKPVGVTDVVVATINTPAVTTVKTNDGPSGTGTTVTATTPLHGTTTVDGNGVITYTPTPNYIGTDTYTYTLTTADGVASDPITVTLGVKPVGIADAATTTLNTPVAITVKTNDGPSATGTTVLATTPAHGTVVVSATGVVTYTPTTGYTGPDTFTYTLRTADGVSSDPVTVSVTVASAIPVGTSDLAITPINTAVTTNVTANDADGTGAVVAAGTTVPAHGAIVVNANGTITYTPANNYTGQDAYSYTITKNGQTSAQIAVTVGVLPVGVADGPITTSVSTPVTINVKTNDGPSAVNTTVTPVNPSHGTVTVDGNGVVTYTPTPGYTGPDSFTYTLTTPDGVESDPITVSITVSALPVGVADTFTTTIGTAVTGNVAANDGTAGVGATVNAGTAPAHGAIVVNADGTITYTPVAAYTGVDTYTYTLTKAGVTSAPITVTIRVKPVGVADPSITVSNSGPTNIDVKTNDGPSGTNNTVTATQPAHGTVTINAAGQVVYTPTAGYTGTDTFTYTLTTPDGVASDPITVTLNVTALPVGVADNVTTNINVPITTTVTANDGPDGTGSVVAAGSTAPAHGSVVVNANGTITYSPVSTYVGKDTYTYTLTKNGQTSQPITVTINIKPTGSGDVAFTGINTPVTITVKANDNPGTPAPTVTTSVPANGTTTVNAAGQVIYTPAAGYTGQDSFTYVLTTPDGVASDLITVTVTTSSSTGVPDADITAYNTPVTTNVKANDGAVNATSTVTATNGSHGTTTVNADGTVTYTPNNYAGLDTYTYTLTNGAVVSSPIIVTISVKPSGTFDGAITPINTPVTTAVKNNDQSAAGTTVIAANGSHGTTTVDANGNITYTPANNYTGTDTYTYTLVTADGVSSDPIPVTVSVRLIGVADAVNTSVNTPVTTPVKANDGVSGNGANVTPTNGAHGTTTVNAAGAVTYTPANGYIGVDTYTYILSIPGAVSDPITVTVNITAPGVPDAFSININTVATTNVKLNDGANNANATVAIATSPAHGRTSVSSSGIVTYIPDADYVGLDSYTYTLTLNGAVSAPIIVSITVKPVGTPDLLATTLGAPVVITVRGNDGPSGVGATVTVNPPLHGTTTTNAAGQVIYTPAAGYLGPDNFTYTLTNNGATSDPITVTVAVRASGVNDTGLTLINTPLTTVVKANDGTASQVATVAANQPSHGTTVVNANNTVTYTPATGYTGADAYTYILIVNGVVSDPITVNLTVYTTGLSLTKVATNTGSKVGDVLNYTIVVTNTGTITLANVTVSDPGADAGSVTPANIPTLAAGASSTVTAKHTLTQADLDRGSYTNIASVTADNPNGNGTTLPPVTSDDPTTGTPGDGTTTVINPITSVRLVKTGVSAINTITYTFVFTNTGNTTISNLTLTDAKLGINSLPMAIPAAGLAPNASFTYTALYTLTDADKLAGTVANSASATATTPGGSSSTSSGPTGSTTTTLPASPVAVNDGATTNGTQPVMIPVLINDNPISAPFIPTSVEIITPPAHGTVIVNPDGTMTYTPTNGYSGADTYTYRVKDTNGYYTNIATVTINNSFAGITPPTLFTPNGDGINDTFEIRGLGQFAENDITIVNRWGNEVFKTKNYQNNWTGEGLNEGTYYYVLRVKLTAADNYQTIKGWVTLLRTFKK